MAIEIPSQVAKRLETEQIIWLTTTKADGTPLPNPVWFYWTGEQFLVFTESKSVKWKNMASNSKVALNMNSDPDGGDVAIFQAEASLNGPPPSADEFNSYTRKYREGMASIGLTIDSLKTFSLVRIIPTKYRTAL
ncbi:MAG: pyridoxamine 5'-phosphate oxidase family protein [Blastocatellia bacterium]|nr:pyridoxamine 5'-phosphate oxidase family protein [Blastocatellia bacterium]